MIQYFKLPYNVPSYPEVKAGDVICATNPSRTHFHLYKVIEKEKRYAKLHMELIKCSDGSCQLNHHFVIDYCDIKNTGNHRYVGRAAQVLFGESNVNNQ